MNTKLMLADEWTTTRNVVFTKELTHQHRLFREHMHTMDNISESIVLEIRDGTYDNGSEIASYNES